MEGFLNFAVESYTPVRDTQVVHGQRGITGKSDPTGHGRRPELVKG